jgi:hypothetical protein
MDILSKQVGRFNIPFMRITDEFRHDWVSLLENSCVLPFLLGERPFEHLFEIVDTLVTDDNNRRELERQELEERLIDVERNNSRLTQHWGELRNSHFVIHQTQTR